MAEKEHCEAWEGKLIITELVVYTYTVTMWIQPGIKIIF